MVCYLVHLESSGNQRYIFDTTKRRENIGASEVIYRLGGWLLDALDPEFPGFSEHWRMENGDAAELVSAAGGAASVVVTDAELGRRLVTEVTWAALRDAPGLDVCGVLSAPFDWDGVEYERRDGLRVARSPLAVRTAQVRAMIPAARAARPGPVTRFARLPIVAECAASGLPASELVQEGTGPRGVQARSAVSIAKRDHQRRGYRRLAAAAGLREVAPGAGGRAGGATVIERIADQLADGDDWVAVIHADGNSLGDLFAGLDSRGARPSCAGYARDLRSLSAAVTGCTERAFRAAFLAATEACPAGELVEGWAPVLPLVLGGDDVTVLCLGQVALPFLAAFLTAFEDETRGDADIRRFLPEGLTACAGMAAVKPHFPFSAAYDLAEELTKEAKRVVKSYAPPAADGRPGRPDVSAFSFHVLFDGAGRSLAELRAAMSVPGATLVAQPYVTTPAAADVAGNFAWVRGRHYRDLEGRVRLLRRRRDPAVDGDRERRLPSSQVHDLRAALLDGVEVATGLYRQLERTYGAAGLGGLGGLGDGLFFDAAPRPGSSTPTTMTGLLDALFADELLPPLGDLVAAGAGGAQA